MCRFLFSEVVYQPEDPYSSFSTRRGPEYRSEPKTSYEAFIKNSIVPQYLGKTAEIKDKIEPKPTTTEAPKDIIINTEVPQADSTETEASEDIDTTTAMPVDPIADHVNKLLRHYLTSERPMEGVPALLFDDETGSVVLEYVSSGIY